MNHGKGNKVKLLVLGGSGYLGNEIIIRAIKKNWKVVSVSRKKKKGQLVHKNLKNLYFDVTNFNKLKSLSKYKFDYIINVSGYVDHSSFTDKGIDVISNHLLMIVNLISVINKKKLKKFLQVGSSEEYGLERPPLIETKRESPHTVYAASKVASTHFLQMLNRSEGFPVTIIRLFLVYGPKQKNNRIIPYLIKNCLNNLSFNVSTGKQMRDFIYIDDTLDAIFLALKSRKSIGEIYNLGSGKATSIFYLVNLIRNILEGGRPKFGGYTSPRPENKNLVANIDKIKRDLKWSPKINLQKGLEKTIKYHNGK